MRKTFIPADHEIRVLLTIKNGEVNERQLLDSEVVGSLETFIVAGRDLGYFASLNTMNNRLLKKAFDRLAAMLRIVDLSLEDILGSLYADMYDILNQIGALVVVVRVPEIPFAEDLQRAAIIQGIEALQLGQSTFNYNPRLLIAPEWSTDDGVGKALESMADKCRAVTYLDSPPMATPEEVVRRAQQYGGRVEILRPRIMVVSDITGKTHSRPYSAAAAGHRVRIDSSKGVQWSKSNQPVYGFTGLEQVDSYLINDPTCTANQLNQANVSTIIQMDGYKHWGNRLCSSDPQWRYESVRRVMDSVEDSIQLMVTKEYIDAPNSESMRTSMLGSVNSYLRDQTSAGVIAGGSAWLDDELNTDVSLAAGMVYINIAITPYSPMEQVIIRYSVNKTTGQVSLAQAA